MTESVQTQRADQMFIRLEPSYFEKINAVESRVLKVVLLVIYWICNFFSCGRHHTVHSQRKAIFATRPEYDIQHLTKRGERKFFSREEGCCTPATPGSPVAGREKGCFTPPTPSTPRSEDEEGELLEGGFDVSRLKGSVDRPRLKRAEEGKYKSLSLSL